MDDVAIGLVDGGVLIHDVEPEKIPMMVQQKPLEI